MNSDKAKNIIQTYRGKKNSLISLLQDIQKAYGYIPEQAIQLAAKEMNIFPVRIYEVITFYTQFKLNPPGKHTIKVCQGTACHVMGGKELLDYLSNKLNIKEGQTTKDGLFSLERVACLGCCGMAPVVVIDNEFFGNCTYQKIDYAINKYLDGGKSE